MTDFCRNLLTIEDINDEIENLETLVELTRNFCLSKEFQSIHYNLSNEKSILLSKERNHYINMLSITLDRLDKIKKMNDKLID